MGQRSGSLSKSAYVQRSSSERRHLISDQRRRINSLQQLDKIRKGSLRPDTQYHYVSNRVILSDIRDPKDPMNEHKNNARRNRFIQRLEEKLRRSEGSNFLALDYNGLFFELTLRSNIYIPGPFPETINHKVKLIKFTQ